METKTSRISSTTSGELRLNWVNTRLRKKSAMKYINYLPGSRLSEQKINLYFPYFHLKAKSSYGYSVTLC